MKRVALVALIVACSGPSTPAPEPVAGNSEPPPPPPAAGGAPSCEAVVDHVIKMMGVRDDRAEGIAECERSPWSDDLKRCVIDAQNERALMECVQTYPPGDRVDEPAEAERSEGEVNLNAIKKGAKAYFQGSAQFPKGSVALSPPKPCCEFADAKCPPDPSVWTQPVWEELNFLIDDAHLYRYSYQSDGATFRAIAEADLDCDGVVSSYTLDGRIENGAPVFTLTRPAHAE